MKTAKEFLQENGCLSNKDKGFDNELIDACNAFAEQAINEVIKVYNTHNLNAFKTGGTTKGINEISVEFIEKHL